MSRTRLFLITALGALAVPLLAASGAQADVASCATGGAAGPITPGVQSVQNDLLDGDLLDTDNDISEPGLGWEDGVYEFHGGPDSSSCIYVDETDPSGPFVDDTGTYLVQIDSKGAYDNQVCGTGLAIDRGAGDLTTVTALAKVGPPGGGGGEDVTEVDYRVRFAGGNGPISISKATTSGGNTLTGDGVVHITPQQGFGNCATQDVTRFVVASAFTASD